MSKLRSEKADVQSFYDEFGWLEDDSSDYYMDACVYEDLRPVTSAYRARANARVEEALQPPGALLLDVASGPIQYDDYLRFSDGYRKRVCVDLSVRGLLGARKRIGDHGLFVQGDVTRMPFKDGVFDNSISLHTIYHVPADEQHTAVKELVRTLQPGQRAAVVYTWPGLLSRAKRAVMRVPGATSILRRRGNSIPGDRPPVATEGTSPSLYFHPHDLRWFRRHFGGQFELEIRCWRSVSVPFLKRVPGGGMGRPLLRFISSIEDRWPGLLGRIGKYPLIIIHKSAVN